MKPHWLLTGVIMAGCRSDAKPLQVPKPTREVTDGTAAAKVGGTWRNSTVYCIEANGRASQVHTRCPSGDAELDGIYRAAVQEWQFKPAMQAGKAVQSCTVAQFEVEFPKPPKSATSKPPVPVTGRVIHKPEPDGERVHRVTSGYRGRGCTFVNLTSFCVDLTGGVIRVATRRSSGIEDLDVVLRETIASWQFAPFVVDGEPRLTCTEAAFQIRVM